MLLAWTAQLSPQCVAAGHIGVRDAAPQKLHSIFEGMFAVNQPQQMPGHPPIFLCMLLTNKNETTAVARASQMCCPAGSDCSGSSCCGCGCALRPQTQPCSAATEAPSIRTHTCPGLRLNSKGDAAGCTNTPCRKAAPYSAVQCHQAQ